MTEDPPPEDLPVVQMASSSSTILCRGFQEEEMLSKTCLGVISMEVPLTGKWTSQLKATQKMIEFNHKGGSYGSVLCTFVYLMEHEVRFFTNKST